VSGAALDFRRQRSASSDPLFRRILAAGAATGGILLLVITGYLFAYSAPLWSIQSPISFLTTPAWVTGIEQADGSVKLVGVASDQCNEAVFLQVNGLAIVMLDDLQDLGPFGGAGSDFDEDKFFGNGVTIGVLDAMNDVDELIHLHDDLVQAFWMTADANGHAAEAWIASLGDYQRLNVKAATAEDSTDAAEDTRLVVHHDAERVDVDDVGQRGGLFIGGGGDAVAHGDFSG